MSFLFLFLTINLTLTGYNERQDAPSEPDDWNSETMEALAARIQRDQEKNIANLANNGLLEGERIEELAS